MEGHRAGVGTALVVAAGLRFWVSIDNQDGCRSEGPKMSVQQMLKF